MSTAWRCEQVCIVGSLSFANCTTFGVCSGVVVFTVFCSGEGGVAPWTLAWRKGQALVLFVTQARPQCLRHETDQKHEDLGYRRGLAHAVTSKDYEALTFELTEQIAMQNQRQSRTCRKNSGEFTWGQSSERSHVRALTNTTA